MEKKEEPAVCAAALARFSALDPAGWAGLPAGCSLDDLTATFPLHRQEAGRGYLGAEHLPAQFYLLSAPAFRRPLRAWFRDERLILLEGILPVTAAGAAPETPTAGAPDARLDFSWGGLLLREAEWVYASRGLALFVNPATGVLLGLLAFVPTTVDEYLSTLRLPSEDPAGTLF